MATLAAKQIQSVGDSIVYAGGVGVNDNDVVVQTGDVRIFDTFMVTTTAGVVDVLVTLDGTNYSTAPLSLADLGGTALEPVLVTVANRVYGFRGSFQGIRVLQNGATAAENVTLVCSTNA